MWLAAAAGAVVHREGMGGVTLDGVTVLAPSRGGLEGDAFIRGLCLDLDVGSACVITGPRYAAVGCEQCLVLKTDDGLVVIGAVGAVRRPCCVRLPGCGP